MITVLCVMPKSNYYTIPKLDLWDASRDAYFFHGSNPVITHAPCQQWSRMKAFARPDLDEKELAFHCLKYVVRNGGIFEHPQGSSFFKEAGITKNLYSIDQSWYGFPARKRTWLWFNGIKPLPFTLPFTLPFNKTIPEFIIGSKRRGKDMKKAERSLMPLTFCEYLVNCVKQIL